MSSIAPKDNFSTQLPKHELASLINELEHIRSTLLDIESSPYRDKNTIDLTRHYSAQNLLHYIALRRHDLRDLQLRLTRIGLSSLGRSEAHVLASLDAVLAILHRLVDDNLCGSLYTVNEDAFETGRLLLRQRTLELLGDEPAGRNVRIMVTMPQEAARDWKFVHQLLKQGMDCMRINCAHDSPQEWLAMIRHLRKAEEKLGRTCRILMDLPGPKLRTGHLESGPEVLRIHPKRDAYGHVITPVRIWLRDELSPRDVPGDADVTLLVSSEWLACLAEGDTIKLIDTADRDRRFYVASVEKDGVWARCSQTTFVMSGTVLEHCGKSQETLSGQETLVQGIPPMESVLLLHQGDLLLIRADQQLGCLPKFDDEGKIIAPAQIGCTLPEVFPSVSAGNSVWLDDGKIGAIVERNNNEGLLVRITHARPDGEKLRSDKGINFPDTQLDLPALTLQDKEYLRFAVEHADIVAMSFANCEADVRELISEIKQIGKKSPGIVLKIETRHGFENLPRMLLEAMHGPACGVMIARGDLAVECGYQRMAEIQEEILWICEAAHMPVIWATQVLETMARDGIPSRAEITDAAMGHRAECVMLNKGAHILKALGVLDDILQRMDTHQDKKRPQMRKLKLASAYNSPKATQEKILPA